MSRASDSRILRNDSASSERCLVFISASKEDYAWRDKLKAKLDSYDDIEWWDDSRISTGADWKKEIEEAISRATVAVVLLSRAYLSSVTATFELEGLKQQADTKNTLRLFAINLEGTSWQQHTAMRNIHIWAGAKPVGSLRARLSSLS